MEPKLTSRVCCVVRGTLLSILQFTAKETDLQTDFHSTDVFTDLTLK